ncbi:hypothetical protein ACH5RR_007142 [Cinchona calisaya]|uniref:Uncharacterized protein n=1 Tax=Cinchona calisaya TaxID=153742 RepID=A0ABD3AR26_9GENT
MSPLTVGEQVSLLLYGMGASMASVVGQSIRSILLKINMSLWLQESSKHKTRIGILKSKLLPPIQASVPSEMLIMRNRRRAFAVVSIEQFQKSAATASSSLSPAGTTSYTRERGINFYGPGDDKINTLTAPGEVRRAFLSEISDCTWSRFVGEDATVGNDTIVREFISNTHKLTGTIVQVRKRYINFSREVINAYYQIPNIDESEHAIFKRVDSNCVMLLRELCDPHVPDGVTLCIGSKISPDKPITGPWIHLTLKKHDKFLQDLIAKQHPRAQEEQVVLNSQNHGQQGTWELPPPAHPDYVFRRPRTEADLRSLAVYHSWSLHTLHRKLDSLAHQLHPAQPLDLPNWPLEPDAPSWHFGPPVDDEYGPGSEELENEYADHAVDDEVGPSGRS